MLFAFNFCITYTYFHNCVHMIFKRWNITITLSYFLLCAVHLKQGFVSEKMLKGNQNYFQDRSFLTGNEENPALVLSNVHNRTSARDGPMFGYKGLSMNTTSLCVTSAHYHVGISASFLMLIVTEHSILHFPNPVGDLGDFSKRNVLCCESKTTARFNIRGFNSYKS